MPHIIVNIGSRRQLVLIGGMSFVAVVVMDQRQLVSILDSA